METFGVRPEKTLEPLYRSTVVTFELAKAIGAPITSIVTFLKSVVKRASKSAIEQLGENIFGERVFKK